MAKEIDKYITQRYERWHDYALYHCTHAGIADEASDVLNEVLCALLQKPEDFVLSLLHKKSGQYTELDFFVLRMIKLNATSDTSPYRSKYKPISTDENTDYQTLEIEDEPYEENDAPGEIISQINTVRQALTDLNVSEQAKRVFEHRFFGEPFKEWSGNETKKELYETYQNVLKLIKDKLNGKILF